MRITRQVSIFEDGSGVTQKMGDDLHIGGVKGAGKVKAAILGQGMNDVGMEKDY